MADQFSKNSVGKLIEVLNQSPLFKSIFERSHDVKLNDWYVAGGCITQTIWNWNLKLDLLHGLKDVDLVYFDSNESENDEITNRRRIQKLFADLPLPIDLLREHCMAAKLGVVLVLCATSAGAKAGLCAIFGSITLFRFFT